MTPSSERPVLVTFRGGFVADWLVVDRLLDLERRGVRFELVEGGRFRVVPGSALTEEDRAFLRARRNEAHAIIAYYSDASSEAPL